MMIYFASIILDGWKSIDVLSYPYYTLRAVVRSAWTHADSAPWLWLHDTSTCCNSTNIFTGRHYSVAAVQRISSGPEKPQGSFNTTARYITWFYIWLHKPHSESVTHWHSAVRLNVSLCDGFSFCCLLSKAEQQRGASSWKTKLNSHSFILQTKMDFDDFDQTESETEGAFHLSRSSPPLSSSPRVSAPPSEDMTEGCEEEMQGQRRRSCKMRYENIHRHTFLRTISKLYHIYYDN